LNVVEPDRRDELFAGEIWYVDDVKVQHVGGAASGRVDHLPPLIDGSAFDGLQRDRGIGIGIVPHVDQQLAGTGGIHSTVQSQFDP
jgi:hypothetical protein